MSQLWPRLSAGEAVALFDGLDDASAADDSPVTHSAQTFAPTGGGRVSDGEILELRAKLVAAASRAGFPTAGSASARVAFDREAAYVLTDHMDIAWSEASNRGVWTFLALVPLTRLTDWRFGRANRERWIASDLTRHTWSRLWWQATVFAGERDLLFSLNESDLNQLFERRAIGGDVRLTVALSRQIVSVTASGDGRRDVIRDATARLRRRLAFTDPLALDDRGVTEMCEEVVAETLTAIAAR